MTAKPCLLILIVKLAFYSTTVTSSPLTDILVFRPDDDDVRNAVENLRLPEETKVALSGQYINVGNYANDFIQLLNSYMTFQNPAVRFNVDEIRLLTTGNTEDPLNDKILAQLKYYRKMQEIQCADYVTLQYKLYHDTKRNTEEIAEHVYNMISTAYRGKFVAFKWLWELHINLWTPDTDDEAQPSNTIVSDLEKFRKPLGDLIGMCVQHKYITDGVNDEQNPDRTTVRPYLFGKIVEFYQFNREKHQLYKNTPALTFAVEDLALRHMWYETSFFTEPLPYVDIAWAGLQEVYERHIRHINEQFDNTNEWKADPFRHIKHQQSFVDIMRVTLYCYIWAQLSVYNPAAHRLNAYYKTRILNMLKFSYIQDKTLNRVITLYDTLKNPNHEQINKVLKIVTEEINRIVTSVIGPNKNIEVADISYINKVPRIEILLKVYNHFLEFEQQFTERLGDLTMDILLFFISGSKNTDLTIFP